MDNINIEFEEKWNDSDIKSIMNKVSNRYKKNIDHDDIESIKMNTLWNCIKKFDESKGTKFTSYLFQQLTYAFKNKVKSKRSEFNFDELEKQDTKYQEKLDVIDIMNSLDEETYQILQQKFYQNMTMKEIGKTNGYSRETARRKFKNAITLCKNMYKS
jgi:RNA polymerase sigma factor (sigma-70 family)